MRRLLIGATVLAALVCAVAPALAATPGLNGSIAFTSDRNGSVNTIWSMTATGDAETQRTVNAEGDNDASYSPDGIRIAFTRSFGGNQEIFIGDADGAGSPIRFTTSGGTDMQPTWSPDGTRIAWASDRVDNFDIYSAPVGNPNDVTRLTSNGAFFDDQPAWSPDGRAIAFHSGRPGTGGGGQIWRASASGLENDVRQVTTVPSEWPDWSPDGSRIVFSSTRPSTVDNIFSLPSAGTPEGGTAVETDLRQHTNDANGAVQPAWSPDGTRIAFSSFRTGTSEIWTVNSPGLESGPLQLTDTAGADIHPTWQTVAALPFLSAITPAAATAGSAPVTLTVSGSDFTHRSRVRWQGQDRVTTFVSPTRLTAAIPASDLAGAGTAQVTVVTGPTGGGTSGTLPFTVQAQAPPPPTPLVLTRALFEKKWAVSRLKGRLLLAGTVARPASLRVRVLRPSGRGTALVTRTFTVTAAGAFSRRLLLPPTLRPGRYLVRATEVGSGPGLLPAADRRSLLAAPREGVVSRAFFSTKINGRSFTRITGRSIIFAHFRFAARAKPGKKITVRWFSPGSRRPVAIDRKPARSLVIAFIKSTGPLPRGAWRAELRYGRKLVSTARVVLR